MDWKIFFTVFGTVFLAELGDKTQLATLMFSTQAKSPWLVFAGAALALAATTLIAVLVGQAAESVIPERPMKIVAGAGFMIIGGLILFQTLKG